MPLLKRVVMNAAVVEHRSVSAEQRGSLTSNEHSRTVGTLPKVLVIDDEKAMCEILSRYLRCKGLEVWTAQTPLEAVKSFDALRFDLVILDWDLAGVETLDLLNLFKALRPEMPVIIVTGIEVDATFLKKTLAGRAAAVLHKLGGLDALASEVNRLVAK